VRTRFGARRRLRTAAEFDAVFKRGRRLGGRLFLIVATPNQVGRDRLGLAVSRRTGNAAERNRARRLLRESFRRIAREDDAGLDLVIVAHRAIAACRQAEVDSELRDRYRRLEPRGAAPAARR
jgi:ribonuclease P protein component